MGNRYHLKGLAALAAFLVLLTASSALAFPDAPHKQTNEASNNRTDATP